MRSYNLFVLFRVLSKPYKLYFTDFVGVNKHSCEIDIEVEMAKCNILLHLQGLAFLLES